MYNISYSGKFSLVQNFAEVLATALEEILVVFNFAISQRGDHTHIDRSHPRKTQNFAPCENFPLYGTTWPFGVCDK
jgi:hypothetical protein